MTADTATATPTTRGHHHSTLWRHPKPWRPSPIRSAEDYAAWESNLVDLTPQELEQMEVRAAAIEASGGTAFDAGWYDGYTARVHGYKDLTADGIRVEDWADYCRGQRSTDDLASSMYCSHRRNEWRHAGHGVYRMAEDRRDHCRSIPPLKQENAPRSHPAPGGRRGYRGLRRRARTLPPPPPRPSGRPAPHGRLQRRRQAGRLTPP